MLGKIADYVHSTKDFSDEAYQTARLCLLDALGCAYLALNYPACTKLLGPIVPGTTVPHGAPVPGTNYILDPIRAAFNIGTMIRWLDYNDTFLAKEWGHPSDNLGGILALAGYQKLTVKEVLTALIKAYEIQGVLSLENSYNRIGLDHVIFVKVATSAVAAHLLGLSHRQTIEAVSHAFIDNAPLRVYRHGKHTGSRKSWAAGDATSRGVLFAWMTQQGEMGYPEALTAKKWGVHDVLFGKKPLLLDRPLNSYIVENILFKAAFPAEFHAQTAVEAALKLQPEVQNRLDEIEKIEIHTQEPAMRIIDKRGPLTNPADRDHCLRFMVAAALLHGKLEAKHYEESHPEIEKLREKMVLIEHKPFTKDYLDPEKRSIANRVTIFLKNKEQLGPVTVEFPLGHKRRRKEATGLLFEKFERNVSTRLDREKVKELMALFQDHEKLLSCPVTFLF